MDTQSNRRLSKGQKAATTFAALGGFVDGFDLLLISAALLLLVPYFDLTAAQAGRRENLQGRITSARRLLTVREAPIVIPLGDALASAVFSTSAENAAEHEHA